MANIIKFTGEQVSINTTPTDVSSAKLVRINNLNANSDHLITQKSNGGITIASFTLLFAGGDESFVYLMKDPTDTIESDDGSSDVVATACAFY